MIIVAELSSIIAGVGWSKPPPLKTSSAILVTAGEGFAELPAYVCQLGDARSAKDHRYSAGEAPRTLSRCGGADGCSNQQTTPPTRRPDTCWQKAFSSSQVGNSMCANAIRNSGCRTWHADVRTIWAWPILQADSTAWPHAFRCLYRHGGSAAAHGPYWFGHAGKAYLLCFINRSFCSP